MLLLSLAASAVLAAPAPAKAAPAATYGFGSGTEIVYYVEHPMHHVKGVTHALDGQVAFADGKPVAPFTLSLPLISFNSGNANRDENAAHVLDVPHYPLATLEVKQFTEKTRAKNGQATHLTGLATEDQTFAATYDASPFVDRMTQLAATGSGKLLKYIYTCAAPQLMIPRPHR